MPRTDALLNRWRSQRRPFAAIALTAVLMLLLAPLRTVIAGCDLCPLDCPMHAAHRSGAPAAPGSAPHMRCHNAAATSDAAGPRIARPPCGTHGVVLTLELAPMVPPQPLSWTVAPRVEPAMRDDVYAAHRATDPPDTPPPDVRA